jgi:pyrroloquinoline quinone biosynthesis protein B
MLVRILGSAAGGRFPQWNCGCLNCRGVRTGAIRARERTQDSVAVSADGHSWFLLNASPDVLTQIERQPALQPRGLRHSPLAGILLSNGDLDHVLGLFSLRESHPLTLYATRAVYQGLAEGNAVFETLRRHPRQLSVRTLELGSEVVLQLADGSPSGLTARAIAVPGKLPAHLERSSRPSAEDNVCFLIHDTYSAQSLLYASSVASVRGPSELFHMADCLLFDGTFWTNDELIRQGVGTASAEQMAHLPIYGETGSLALLKSLTCRRIFTHINNTNPILSEDSAERAEVEARGWEVAHDGMELCL